jgi:Transposase DDE domain group 1
MTECTQTSFEFEGHFSRQVVARFDGGQQTSDAGALLLRETDRRLKLLSRFGTCFIDGRDATRIEHRVEEMVAQRIYGLALGYEDLNDHEQLRHDPLLVVLAGKADVESALAGKSTLNRLELSTTKEDRYKKILCQTEAIDQLLVDVFIESYREAPDEIVLDLDATDLPIHGHQEGRFFHGFYDHYCYLPLYIFCEDHLLGARLRQSNIDGSSGALEEVQRIVAQIRQRWRGVRIRLGFLSGWTDELVRRQRCGIRLRPCTQLQAGRDPRSNIERSSCALSPNAKGSPGIYRIPIRNASQLEPDAPRYW